MTSLAIQFDPRDPKWMMLWIVLALIAQAALIYLIFHQLGIIR